MVMSGKTGGPLIGGGQALAPETLSPPRTQQVREMRAMFGDPQLCGNRLTRERGEELASAWAERSAF